MLDFFLSYILIYGQLMLFAVALLASFGFPFPITALAVASGALSAQGYFGLGQIIVYCLIWCVIGDGLGYWIARKYGKTVFQRIGMDKVLTSPQFMSAELGLEKHYRSMIFYSRFIVTFMGPPINIIAGLGNISYRKFLIYALLGQVIYAISFISLGYAFSDQWENISDLSWEIGTIIALLALLIVLIISLVKYLKKGE